LEEWDIKDDGIYKGNVLRKEKAVKAEELVGEFLALSEKEQMNVLRKIIPPFCRGMMVDEKKLKEMFYLFAGECGQEMKEMMSAMATMFGHKGCK
jgi:hypothetical protein